LARVFIWIIALSVKAYMYLFSGEEIPLLFGHPIGVSEYRGLVTNAYDVLTLFE
jgi:hypothetical protein